MKFFTFSQNNSGGSFDFQEDRGITHTVVIEAKDAEDANNRAEARGLYFDGCDSGLDCACCGDRWYRVGHYGDDGDDVPSVYRGQPLGVKKSAAGFMRDGWMEPGRETAVHYADGRIKWFNADNTEAA